MSEEKRFVIQKLEIRKAYPGNEGGVLVWVDVKGNMNAEETMISLDNFVQNNPEYNYRIVKVFATVIRPIKE